MWDFAEKITEKKKKMWDFTENYKKEEKMWDFTENYKNRKNVRFHGKSTK